MAPNTRRRQRKARKLSELWPQQDEAITRRLQRGDALDGLRHISEARQNIFLGARQRGSYPADRLVHSRWSDARLGDDAGARLGFTVQETVRGPRESLYVADEVFVSGTAAEVEPIVSVTRFSIGQAGAAGR